jgi:predicted DNA-binding mobile mystery protein A
MAKSKFDLLHQEQLDRRIETLRTNSHPLSGGWIRNIREGLGMTLKQLSERLEMTPQSLMEIERSESEGRITVSTLNRVAEVLGAEVRIAVIPSRSLSEMVNIQARKAATKIVEQTQTHMALENQGNSEDFLKKQIEKLTDELVRTADRRIWDLK